jgi:hypothetical protein
MLSKRELLEDNEELICLLNDVLECCEEQGIRIPRDLDDRIREFLIVEDDEDDGEVIDITPAS